MCKLPVFEFHEVVFEKLKKEINGTFLALWSAPDFGTPWVYDSNSSLGTSSIASQNEINSYKRLFQELFLIDLSNLIKCILSNYNDNANHANMLYTYFVPLLGKC